MNLPFSPASASTARRALGTWLHGHGFDDGIVDDAQLVVTELVSNALRHARPLPDGGLAVGWAREANQLLITVRDGGGATEPTRLAAGPEAMGGRGLAIVDALGSSWFTEHDPAGSAIHVHLDLP